MPIHTPEIRVYSIIQRHKTQYLCRLTHMFQANFPLEVQPTSFLNFAMRSVQHDLLPFRTHPEYRCLANCPQKQLRSLEISCSPDFAHNKNSGIYPERKTANIYFIFLRCILAIRIFYIFLRYIAVHLCCL